MKEQVRKDIVELFQGSYLYEQIFVVAVLIIFAYVIFQGCVRINNRYHRLDDKELGLIAANAAFRMYIDTLSDDDLSIFVKGFKKGVKYSIKNN